MVNVYFDDVLKTKSGKIIPYYDVERIEHAIDGELVWFHTGYGRMRLYRLLEVDKENYIAEDLHIGIWTCDEDWEYELKHPEEVYMKHMKLKQKH